MQCCYQLYSTSGYLLELLLTLRYHTHQDIRIVTDSMVYTCDLNTPELERMVALILNHYQ